MRYFSIKNMKSDEDAKRVKEILIDLDGVSRVETDLDAQAVEIEYEDTKITKEMMAKILQTHGYFMGI